jgi:actin-like ATPase involved in cell morphogenesis
MVARYQLGIDLGTTWTAAAVCRDGRPEVLPLGGTSSAVATVVFLGADGSMLVGEAAQRRALTEPRRVVREFKRRTGDGTPLLVGDTAVTAEELSARFVAWVVQEAELREGGPAEVVAVTHPAEWGEHRRTAFASALAEHGVHPHFLTEPQAAAVAYAGADRIPPGRAVAVYDLGGGTFDAAVVRRTTEGAFELLGHPVGLDRLGGIDFDDAVFAHVRDALGEDLARLDVFEPSVQAAVVGLRRECTAAKEALSADTEVMITVMLPGLHTRVRLGRAEFEDMIRPAVGETVAAVRRAVDSAGLTPGDLDAVLLVGGSSRIPLIAQLVSAELGRSVVADADPKAVVAAGAALAAHATVAEPAPPAVVEGGRPDAPPVAFADAPSGARGWNGHRTLLLAASVALAAGLGVSAAVAGGLVALPIPAAAAAPGAADVADGTPALPDPATGAALPALDPWTGAVPVDTTVAGPRRPGAVPATVRPVSRAVRTGAPGASAAVPAPAAPGAVVAPAGPPGATAPAAGPPGAGTPTGGGGTGGPAAGSGGTDPGTGGGTGGGSDPGTGGGTAPGTGGGTGGGTDPGTGGGTDPGTGGGTDPGTGGGTDPGTGGGTDPGTGGGTDPGTGAGTDPGTGGGSGGGTDPGTGGGTDPGAGGGGGAADPGPAAPVGGAAAAATSEASPAPATTDPSAAL